MCSGLCRIPLKAGFEWGRSAMELHYIAFSGPAVATHRITAVSSVLFNVNRRAFPKFDVPGRNNIFGCPKHIKNCTVSPPPQNKLELALRWNFPPQQSDKKYASQSVSLFGLKATLEMHYNTSLTFPSCTVQVHPFLSHLFILIFPSHSPHFVQFYREIHRKTFP